MLDFGLVRFVNFVHSFYTLMRIAKGQLLSKEKVMERLEICRTCDQFVNHHCQLCGCGCTANDRSYFNKVAYPTEQCPNNPPRWLQEEIQ